MPRKRNAIKRRQNNLRQTRAFVEDWLGRGTAYSKYTTNHKTFTSTVLKRSNVTEKELLKRKEDAIASTIESGRSSLIYFKDLTSDTMAHEFSHAALNRIKRKLGVKTNIYAEETIAYCLMLEWLRKKNPSAYNRALKKKFKLTVRSFFGPSHSQTHAIAGLNAIMIQQKFSEAERYSLIQDLIRQQFESAYDSSEWIRNIIRTQKK